MRDTDVFMIQSDRKKTLILYGALHIFGCILFWYTDDQMHASAHYKAAYFLGIFLALVGAYGIILSENIRVIVDGRVKNIFYRNQSLFFSKLKTVAFDQVARVSVTRMSKASDFMETYCLNIILKSGEILPTGRWSRKERDLRDLAERIVTATGCASSTSWH